MRVRSDIETVPGILRACADTFEERSKLWGDSYKEAGAVMRALLPNGIELDTAEDWSRFLVFCHVINKVKRYAENLSRGGHQDSAHDLVVYAAMLEELTAKEKKS